MAQEEIECEIEALQEVLPTLDWEDRQEVAEEIEVLEEKLKAL